MLLLLAAAAAAGGREHTFCIHSDLARVDPTALLSRMKQTACLQLSLISTKIVLTVQLQV